MRRLVVLGLLVATAAFTSAYRPFQDIQSVCPKCPEKGDRVLLTDGRTVVCDVIAKNQDGYILQRFGELRFVQFQEISKVMWASGVEPKGLDNFDQILVNNKEQTVLHGTLIEVEAGKPLSMRKVQEAALKQNITTLHNRVNELGTSEPVIQQQGADRVVVQLPGVQDTARAKDIIGRTATLEVRMVDDSPEAAAAAVGSGPACTK